MAIAELIVGIIMLIAGILMFIIQYTSEDNDLLDTSGANIKIYGASIMIFIGGIFLILKYL